MSRFYDLKIIKLKLASAEEILSWSHGEVTKPETINYRTQKAEKDGLFCEKIFGPEKDWECYCGKYRKIRYKGIICDKCGVEVTRAIVRRERMGHIQLASPVSHIWFLRGVPSRLGLILNISVQELEKIIYFAKYIVINVNEEARQKVMQEIEKKHKLKKKDKKINPQSLKEARDRDLAQLKNLHLLQILSEIEYYDFSLKYGQVFEAGIGAQAIRKILEKIDLGVLREVLRAEAAKATEMQKITILKRLRLVEGLIKANIRPESMVLTTLPVLPPDLRPMVALDGGRYATSDLNDLYRRIINRNNRLKKLIELNAPEVICNNEKRMLQEAVDALIDNSARHGQGPVMSATGQRRQLKSLADILKGKQGRFRQNLLGKRVDYSGRSVIVVGPELKLHQCGLPKQMALELFKPFVIQKLVEREFTHNIRGAGKLIEQETDDVWGILEEIIQGRYVLLNRAPTLHRLGVQAFQPVLIEGSAIQIHPSVCRAFNADFDGDQMAVHLPLTEEAQKEAKEIILSSVNLLKPASGEPIVTPTKDMILGVYWITNIIDGTKGENKYFAAPQEAVLAYQFDELDLRAKIKLKLNNQIIETCLGRIIFNQCLPQDMEFINQEMNKKNLYRLMNEMVTKYDNETIVDVLDKIKQIGFEYATQSGISLGMNDLQVPPEKPKLIEKAEKEIENVHRQYLDGLLTRAERKSRMIEIWQEAINEINESANRRIDVLGPVRSIVDSGARGSWAQIAQIVGIKGLVVNPAGEIIELPIKRSFKEGFNVLEYFISTHGARKGTSDTALKTAKAGYLTRRLVDVAQDVVVREGDCHDAEGIYVYRVDGEELDRSLAARVVGRVLLEDIKIDKELLSKGLLIDQEAARKIDESNSEKIKVRSVITCKAKYGICQKCYGYDLGNNRLIQLGTAAGIVTAQAIGEPGTQLTMRTFHTGGIAGGGDITQGLPRVEEIFETRLPKGKGIICEVDGQVIEISEKGNQKLIKIEISEIQKAKASQLKTKSKKTQLKDYLVSLNAGIWVKEGDLVVKGQQLTEGHLDLKDLFKIAGQEAVQRYIIKEVQNIYSSQGEGINDKHIEIIIRQMFSRVKINDSGETNLLAGAIVEKSRFLEENEKAAKQNKKNATATLLLLGISRVSLTTESWLSAASFQETTRVLIDAAIQAKEDKLTGLKENVIIGKLIPAGTGYKKRVS